MKFFCEYCGARIDSEVDRKCPNCGASYKKNKTFLEKEAQKEHAEKNVRDFQETVFNNVKRNMEVSKKFAFIPILMFLVIFIIIISMFIRTRNRMSNSNNNFNKLNNSVNDVLNPENNETKVTASLGEEAKTSEYSFKVTSYNVVDKVRKPDAGYEYIEFDFEVGNLTDNQIIREDVYCIVDGVDQKNYNSHGYSTIPMTIARELKVSGSAIFMVPKDTKSYDIRYGDYVTIHIEK